jgi:Inner membrane component of T3SS, cytoplasmic domain
MNSDPNPETIKISYEEATSDHVNDMLKRQMSMRGEPGVTRERSRRWYYQNWFVFMIVGMLAAVAAWAIIEPFFSDMPYIQGPIEKIVNGGSLPSEFVPPKGSKWWSRIEETGYIQIKGEKVWLLTRTALIRKDGRHVLLDPADLEVGQNIGVYVEYFRGSSTDIALAFYVNKSLRAQSPSRAALTLSQLHNRAEAASFLLFPLVAGMVGLAIGGVDGLVCRLPRRALLCGFIGLLVGFIGGFISHMAAGLVYAPLTQLAMNQSDGNGMSTSGFIIQMVGRSLAWALAGMAMGLGQGIALRSKRLLIYGFIGGVVGGLLGGLLFDPVDFILLGEHPPSAHLSRLIGLAAVGAAVGALIGLVELLARDAWLRMTQGSLAGKEFLLFKDVMNIGSSPRSDIYLFNDPLVAENHAILRAVGDECEIESRNRDQRVLLNSRPVQQARLRHGDQVTIGRTIFVFEKRRG